MGRVPTTERCYQQRPPRQGYPSGWRPLPALALHPTKGHAPMDSPIAYLGGKSRLAKHIVPRIPANHVCYCEPFCGAAWILFKKQPSRHEVINDLDAELVNFWRIVQNHLQPFLDYFKYAVISRKLFDLENHRDPSTLTDLQRAVRYYYLQRLGFGGRPTARTFGTARHRSCKFQLAHA